MRAVSEASLARARERWYALLEERRGREVELGLGAFDISDLLRSQARLSRSLVDVSRTGDDRAELITNVLRGHAADELVELMAGMVRDSWACEQDLWHAIEKIAVDTVIMSAKAKSQLASLEGEIYEVRRLLSDVRSLRISLSDASASIERRSALARQLGENKVSPEAMELMVRAVERAPKQTLATSLSRYLDAAALLGSKLVASVRVASPLTREQEERLARILSDRYHADVSVHVAIDPAVVGGMRIHVGEDVLDATLATRIKGVKDAMTK